MKHLTILLFLLLTVIGCSAENPLCTDNYCVTGEIFPRSDLEIGAKFSEVAIDDSQLFAVLAGVTSVEATTDKPTTTEENTVTLADIVSDVADGGTTYLEQTVTITATVRFKLTTGSITLVTDSDDVSFFVTTYDDPDRFSDLEEGTAYIFTLYIRDIDPPASVFGRYNIWSNLPE